MKKSTKLLSTGSAILITSGSASAALINWSTEALAADGSNVATDGALHAGANYGTGAISVVNGIDFNGAPAGNQVDAVGSNLFDRSTNNTFYDGSGVNVLTDGFRFGASMTFSINNLIAGNQYRIQVVSLDAFLGDFQPTPIDATNRLQIISASDSTDTLDFAQLYDGATSSETSRAALVTGTWTADATDIDFTVALRGANDNAILNGFIVQDLTIPEPSSSLLLALSALTLAARRRR